MSKHAIGLAFLSIGIFLYAAKHIADAIYKGSDLPINAVSYRELSETGNVLLVLAGLSALLGAFCLIRGLRSDNGAAAER